MIDANEIFKKRIDGLMVRFAKVAEQNLNNPDIEDHKNALKAEFSLDELADLFLASVLSYEDNAVDIGDLVNFDGELSGNVYH